MRRLLAPLAVALVVLAAGWPLLTARLPEGHDALAHLPRLVEYHENLRHGIVPPRWAPDLWAGAGLPLFLVSPHLVPALSEGFHLLGLGWIRSHNSALLALYLAAALGMYGATRRLAGGAGAALAASAYALAPYLHLDLYVRQAVSEFAGFACLPPLLWGAERLGSGHHRRGILLVALGIGGAGAAHNGVLLMATPLALLLAFAAAAGAAERRAVTLLGGLAGIGLGLLLGAFAWAPALLEHGDLRFDRLTDGYFDYRQHFVGITQLGSFKWAHGFSLPGRDDGMSFSLGPLHVLLAGIGLATAVAATRARPRSPSPSTPPRLTRALAAALALAAAIATLCTLELAAPLWRYLPWLHYFSFPWRFLAVPAFALAVLAGLAGAARPGLAGVAIALLLALNLPHARPRGYLTQTDADFTPETIAARDLEVGWALEFLPRWVTIPKRFPIRPFTLDPRGRELARRPDARRYSFTLSGAEAVSLPITYFPDWRLEVDGEAVAARPAPRSGLIELDLAAGTHEVRARFVRSPTRIAAEGASLVGAVLLAALGLASLRRPAPET